MKKLKMNGRQKNKKTNDGQRKKIVFSELQSHFDEPEIKYAPFEWLTNWEKMTKNDSETLNLLVSESINQRANPGYVFICLKERDRKSFLSPEYLDIFGDALKIAEDNGVALSYCDEWTWPSGQAGGNLLEKHPELRAETLYYEIREVLGGQTIHLDESFFTVAARCEGGSWKNSAKIISSTLDVISQGPERDWDVPPPPSGYWRIYRFVKRLRNMPEVWGRCNVNYLDRRLPGHFIELAHQPYEERFGEYFGKTIPGFFMDHEGAYGRKLAWSDDFENEYRQKKGRDIRLWMPLMIHKDSEGKWAKARWDWYDVVSDLYADNLLKKVSEWAAERGMYHTIHCWEENLIIQAIYAGSIFKAMRAVSLPGVDCLGDLGLWVRLFKETQSVTEFEGRRFMSECFGAKGWNLSPVLMKKVANSMTTWGVSHVIPAAVAINRDLRKVIYPHELYGMPYWRHLHKWNDFVRRTSYVNSHGHMVPDALIVYPIDSVWAAIGGNIFDANVENLIYEIDTITDGWMEPKALVKQEAGKQTDNAEYIDRVEEIYTGIIKDLDALRVEFLIADSEYIQAMDVSSEGRLTKGDFNFKAVILPPLLILPFKIMEKILSFAQKGGEVYFVGEPPTGSTEHGLPDSRMKEIADKLASLPTVYQVEKSIYPYCRKGSGLEPKVEFLHGDFPLLEQHRRIDGKDFYWLANNTGQKRVSQIKFRGAKGRASIWNCETGKITPVASIEEDGGSVLSLVFEPYEGYWLVFDDSARAVANTPRREKDKNKNYCIAEVDPTWKIYINTNDQPPAPYPDFIPAIPEKLLMENGGIKDRLKLWSEWDLTKFSGFVTYENHFLLPEKYSSLMLSLGKLSHFVEVWLNDRFVDSRLWPAYEFDISAFTVKGKNKLKIVIGNLLCNVRPSPGGLFQHKEKAEDFNAGLIGPVRIMSESGKNNTL
ncbi:MAG: glycosyl hydrolase [Candidatus Omnitrophota bacterium]